MGKSIVNQMLRPTRLAAVTAGAVGVALLAAACSSGSSSTPASTANTGSTSTSTGTGASGAAASSSPSGSAATTIGTASSSGGTFLTDGGRAVYLWVKDTGDASTCSGACAGAWPPVTTTGSVTATGSAKPSDLSTITRSDGTKQVTYDGHPLYFFVGDSGPGTATGQGSDEFGAKWWLVAPTGSDVTASVNTFTASASGSGAAPAPSVPSSSVPSSSGPAPSGSASSAGGGWS
jgi:predicted lipoprotein with Yx(FWY)xxD motif